MRLTFSSSALFFLPWEKSHFSNSIFRSSLWQRGTAKNGKAELFPKGKNTQKRLDNKIRDDSVGWRHRPIRRSVAFQNLNSRIPTKRTLKSQINYEELPTFWMSKCESNFLLKLISKAAQKFFNPEASMTLRH